MIASTVDLRLGERLAFEDHVGAEARVAAIFTKGVGARHDDGRRDAEPLGVVGDGLGVVAGRHGDDAAARAPPAVSDRSLTSAPRSLNDEVACRFSYFTKMSAPVSFDRRGAGRNGVRRTTPAIWLGRVADVGEGGDHCAMGQARSAQRNPSTCRRHCALTQPASISAANGAK